MLGPFFSHPLRLGGLGHPAGGLREFRGGLELMASRVLGLLGFKFRAPGV